MGTSHAGSSFTHDHPENHLDLGSATNDASEETQTGSDDSTPTRTLAVSSPTSAPHAPPSCLTRWRYRKPRPPSAPSSPNSEYSSYPPQTPTNRRGRWPPSTRDDGRSPPRSVSDRASVGSIPRSSHQSCRSSTRSRAAWTRTRSIHTSPRSSPRWQRCAVTPANRSSRSHRRCGPPRPSPAGALSALVFKCDERAASHASRASIRRA